MAEIIGLRARAGELEKELESVRQLLSKLGDDDDDRNHGTNRPKPPPAKSGYLFKWQDRTIGFSGSKWSLRFVKADRGRVSYFYSHLENQPRLEMSLRGCAIRDEGWKINRRHPSSNKKGVDPPLDEPGAYFFVFSVYIRPDSAGSEDESNEFFVPLLRFSTPSFAEKTQWIQILSETCAYCETEAFLMEESQRNQQDELRKQQQLKMIQDMPQVERGTLAPLYFAPDKRAADQRTKLSRRPSHAKLPKSTLFRTLSKSRDADKVDRSYPPSKPMHRTSAPSFFSPEAPAKNYRGFFNLAMIILIVSNFHLPALGAYLMGMTAITWMKLLSYAHANQDYRYLSRKDKDAFQTNLAIIDDLDTSDFNIEYPRNISLRNIYYFWLAPTLTYQIAFPKAPRVRPLRVLGLLLRMAIAISLFTFLAAQLVAPNLRNLLRDLEATNGRYTYHILAEYWLKLAVSNTYMWLLMFYTYFHLYLNLFAELLRFGDRVFYKDWWNSAEVSAYWRLWNLPVHYWLVRHFYFPCVRMNLSRNTSTFLVFLFSAVMHEVLISVPFHSLRPWSFLGMMSQIPLVVLTKKLYRKFPGSSIGNILFWVSFCVVGQPMAILLYTIDFTYGKMQHDDVEHFDSKQICKVMLFGKCFLED
eukprot:scaffold22580_cov210-Cylindrotheca_fusiformis.AAC.8